MVPALKGFSRRASDRDGGRRVSSPSWWLAVVRRMIAVNR